MLLVGRIFYTFANCMREDEKSLRKYLGSNLTIPEQHTLTNPSIILPSWLNSTYI